MKKPLRIFILLCATGFALSTTGKAERVTLPIPGEGWTLSFDAPPITWTQCDKTDSGIRYFGSSDNGFNISFFVEDPSGQSRGHKACADYYWPLGKKNPIIDQSTVESEETKDFVKVSYRMRTKLENRTINMPNINLYFEHQGKWVDVHISKLPFKSSDQKILNDFVKSLKYETTTENSDQANSNGSILRARSFPLPKHGELILDIPTEWKQRFQQPEDENEPLPPTITLSPKQGDEFNIMITPFWSQKNDPSFNKSKSVRELIESDLQRMLPDAMEEQVPIQEFKGIDGTGYYFLVTDKATKPGEYPYVIRAGIGTGDLLLYVTILCRSKDTAGIEAFIKALETAKQE